MKSPSTAILFVDAFTGWCLGNTFAMVLVATHPVRMSAFLAVRNVLVVGLFAGVLITLLITAVRDCRRLGLFG